ncbi:MAG TPA: hypothetical protein VLI90_07175, partial [Tepidisphaeraceae bacterium]|nr:hypothetical protein [Tepidisphaeraceae bacterium]
ADEFTNITFKVDIADAGGASDTKNTLISVADTPPTADLSTSANASNEGAVYTLHVGATTDPGPNHITGYAINWGDGNVDTFASGGDPANANFTHTYTDGPAARHISMTLIDEDGPHANSGTHDVTVNNVNPTATLQNLFPSISEGDAGSLNFTAQHDDSSVDTASGFHYAYDFNNDGIFDSGDGSYGGSGTSSSINVPASYLIIPGQHSVKARIIDKDGGFTDYTTTITSANVSPTVNLPANLTAGAGLPFTFTGSFSDPGTSDGPWTGVVDYGDGSGFVALSVNSANHTFQLSHTWATSGPYTLVVHISDHPVSPDGIQPPAASLTGAASSAVNVTATTFQVINFTPTASGFDVQFNRGADLSKLNLYGSSFGGFGASDVSFVGNNTGVVAGSLIWDPSTDTAHFVATGGRLAADTYNVTLFSRADGWTDTSNNALDGDGNNTNGGDFARQFVLSYPLPPRTVSMPDFARGPGQTVDLPNTSSGAGIPITISDAANVLSVDFDLVYNTSLLNITGATLASGLPADWGLTINFISPGRIKFTASGTTPLSAGAKQIIKLTATVPQTAAYAGAADLQIQNLSVNEGNIASVGDSAVEKVAYFGDASGNAVYTGLDAGLISRVVVHLDSGFDAYPLVDPVIVGDVTGDGSLSGLDASFVAQKASNLPRPEIPNIPTGFSIVGGGIDPTFTGSSHTLGLRGGQADFTVLLDQITGITDIGFTITASYTAGVLHLANGDISLGEALPAGWSVVANTDDINGNTVLTFFNGGTNMTSDATKPIVHLGFHVPGNDNPGVTPVQLSGPSVDGTPGHQVSYSYVDGSIDIAPFFTGTAGDDQYTVRLNGTGDTVQVWENQPTSGAPTYSFAASLLSLANFNLFKFTTLGGNDTLTIDYSNGNPLPAGGVIFDGGTNTAGGDTLVLKLGDGGNAVTVDGSGVKVGSTPLNLTSDEHVVINGGSGDDSVTQTAVPAAPFAFNGGAGNDSLSIMAGSYTFTTDASATTASLTVNVDGAGSSVTFSSTEHLAGLHLTGSGTAKITSTATPFTPSVLNVHSLSIASGSTLDITNNEAIIDSSLASIQPDLQAGRIFSSTPVAGEGLGSHALTPTQSVVRLSLLGDTNLDGSVDVGDLGQLASNYGQTSGATWEDGDTNNDGAVDVADLGMLATNYGVSLSNGAAAPSSQAAVFASANVVTAPVATPAAAVAQPAALLSTTSTTISTAKSDVPAVTVTTKSTAKKADHSQVSGNHTRVEPSSTLPLKHKGQKKGDILGDDLKSL